MKNPKTASMKNFAGHPSFGKNSNALIGLKIVDVRYLDDSAMSERGWRRRPPILVLDDGTELMPLCDDEGNDGGALDIRSGNKTTGLPTVHR